MLIQEPNVFQNLADNPTHFRSLEAKEELLFANCLQIFIFQAILHGEFEYFTIHTAAFEIELTLLGSYVLEEIAH